MLPRPVRTMMFRPPELIKKDRILQRDSALQVNDYCVLFGIEMVIMWQHLAVEKTCVNMCKHPAYPVEYPCRHVDTVSPFCRSLPDGPGSNTWTLDPEKFEHMAVPGCTGYIHIGGRYPQVESSWIGLRENWPEKLIFNGKMDGFRCRFFLKPIHW